MKELKSDAQMREFFNETETKGAIGQFGTSKNSNFFFFLDGKDAFFGGRTCVHKIQAEANAENELVYMDIISLYPFINFSLQYPVKVPEIIRPDDCVVNWRKPEDIAYDGLYKVRVVPPKGLFLPVLPMHVNKEDPRLMFPLCIKCANKYGTAKQNPTVSGPLKCNHAEDERGWTSTMTSLELRAALAEGYKITRCYRIWKYTEHENLFKEYVQTFMKMKIESSGFPSNVQSPEEQTAWAKGK
jgi:hypothetical protein